MAYQDLLQLVWVESAPAVTSYLAQGVPVQVKEQVEEHALERYMVKTCPGALEDCRVVWVEAALVAPLDMAQAILVKVREPVSEQVTDQV